MATRNIQGRNVSAALHRKLKARAAATGSSLSDFLLAEMTRLASVPTREEMLARLRSRSRVRRSAPAAQTIREGRD
jgi:hypothetical protein